MNFQMQTWCLFAALQLWSRPNPTEWGVTAGFGFTLLELTVIGGDWKEGNVSRQHKKSQGDGSAPGFGSIPPIQSSGDKRGRHRRNPEQLGFTLGTFLGHLKGENQQLRPFGGGITSLDGKDQRARSFFAIHNLPALLQGSIQPLPPILAHQ